MIKVVDSIMGSGKTNWAIQYMNENSDKRFMYITPYNDEIKDRVIPQCPALNFRFAREGHKINDFKDMLIKGQNIVATHECFKRADGEVEALLETNDYILIMDEVFDVVVDLRYSQDDIKCILDNFATVDEYGRLVWTSDKYQDENGKYGDIMKMAKLGKLIVCDNTFFLWLFPVEFFNKFSEVYIMTYLFPGQIQRYYFDLNKIQYEYYSVIELEKKKYKLVEHDGIVSNKLKPLINIYDGDMNNIGKRDYSLSKGWYDNKNNRPNIEKLRRHLNNFFRHKHNAKSKEIMWTCFKGAEDKKTKKFKYIELLKDDGFASGFVECNARATNKYKDRSYIAYCVNRFMRPQLKNNYFGKRDIIINEDLWALSEMLQFLWRSAIREGNSVNLFIPSKRMRTLLEQFLNNKLEVTYK